MNRLNKPQSALFLFTCSRFSLFLKDPFFQIIRVEMCILMTHTGQCEHTGGCYNELVVVFFSTGGGVKGKKMYTC